MVYLAKLYDTRLKDEQSIKYLGIMIDANLNWQPRIHHIVKKKCRITLENPTLC